MEAAKQARAAGGGGAAGALAALGDLWDESQYAEEFDVGGFVAKLASEKK